MIPPCNALNTSVPLQFEPEDNFFSIPTPLTFALPRWIIFSLHSFSLFCRLLVSSIVLFFLLRFQISFYPLFSSQYFSCLRNSRPLNASNVSLPHVSHLTPSPPLLSSLSPHHHNNNLSTTHCTGTLIPPPLASLSPPSHSSVQSPKPLN